MGGEGVEGFRVRGPGFRGSGFGGAGGGGGLGFRNAKYDFCSGFRETSSAHPEHSGALKVEPSKLSPSILLAKAICYLEVLR